jgi:hypothetical protein
MTKNEFRLFVKKKLQSMGFQTFKPMKYQRILVAMFLTTDILFVLFSSGALTVSASDSQDEVIGQIEEALNISVFYQKETDRLIKCFDVNENGWYAIGYKNNTIQIFDSLGAFQYGYRFETDGTYGIALKENSIVIYLGRSNTAVEIDPTGKCVDAEEVYFSKDFTENTLNRTRKQIGKINYYLERDIGIFHGDYSRLVKADEQGAKIVLYDVTAKGYFVGVCHFIVLGIFLIAGIVFVVKAKKKKRKSSG